MSDYKDMGMAVFSEKNILVDEMDPGVHLNITFCYEDVIFGNKEALHRDKYYFAVFIHCLEQIRAAKTMNDAPMCFSPVASFGASAVLSGIGIVSLTRAQTVAEKFLSAIPMLFAIQQGIEGILWLALANPDLAQLQWPATFGFLIFAQVVWPIYMPIAMLLFEHDPVRKRLLTFCTISGLLLGSYLVFCLLHYPIAASASEHHIKYDLGFALARKWYYGLLYFIPTIVSSLFSSTRRLRWLGYLFLGSYIFARLLFQHFVVSVWCFFGALISIVVLVIVLKAREEEVVAER